MKGFLNFVFVIAFGVLFCAEAGYLRPALGADESPGDLVFGMSTALTGPASDLGRNMRLGVEAAFAETNARGGVAGRRLTLIVLDDGYEPGRTSPNMHTLIEEENVLAVIGNVGTPTAIAALPIAIASGTPFVGAYTGAGVLRRMPPDLNVINFRASYFQETSTMVDALITHLGLKPQDIAFFTQRDSYGDAGFVGGRDALIRNGLKDEHTIIHGRYERNTQAVENGLADMMMAESLPKAVIMVGAYAPCARFIQLAKDFGLDALFLNVSFVGAESLARELGEVGDGVIITQVVPFPESDLPAVIAYRKSLAVLDPDSKPSFGSLEGYMVGQMLIRALDNLDGHVDRDSIISGLLGLGDFDLGLGVPLYLGADDHQASHNIWPTVLKDGQPVPFSWSDLKSLKTGSADRE